MLCMVWFLCLLGAICVSGDGICCASGRCFTDEPPFDGMPLPICPENLGIYFLLFTATEPNDGHKFDMKNVHDQTLYFDKDKPTVMLTHGWTSSSTARWMQDAKNELVATHNVVFIDWKYAGGFQWYPQPVANTRTTAVEVANMMQVLVEAGHMSYGTTWLVGFSLGAPMVGLAGTESQMPIGRVTGLDPAGPWYRNAPIARGLTTDSAKFVDVIHTNGEGTTSYGQINPLGHSDFYPNKGFDQPGCGDAHTHDGPPRPPPKSPVGLYEPVPNPVEMNRDCDHGRVVKYFVDTLRNSNCHIARHVCTDERDLPDSCVETSEPVYVGVLADQNSLVGKFYFETEAREPFCKY